MTERQEYWYETSCVILMMIGVMTVFAYTLKIIGWAVTKI